jgi:hypothetical protein
MDIKHELISAEDWGCPQISAAVAGLQQNGLISRFRFWTPDSREITLAEAVRDYSMICSGLRDGMLIAS